MDALERRAKAEENFLSGYNCTQSVLRAFEDIFPEDLRDTIVSMGSGFGGGMGRLREVCGAVSGMFLICGYLYGYADPDTGGKKAELYRKIQELANSFEEKNQHIVCRELRGLAVKREGYVPEARTKEYYASRPCQKLIGDAAEILQEFIDEQN